VINCSLSFTTCYCRYEHCSWSCRYAVLALAGAEPFGVECSVLSCACVNRSKQFTLQNSDKLLAAELVLGFAPMVVFAENGLLLDKAEYRFAKEQSDGGAAFLAQFEFAFVSAALSYPEIQSGIAQQHIIGSEVR